MEASCMRTFANAPAGIQSPITIRNFTSDSSCGWLIMVLFRTDSMPVTTVAGGYRGNPYLCGTHIEAPACANPNYRDSYTAQSMMRYGYGAPYNPNQHQASRPTSYGHNYANAGETFYPAAKTECRPRYFHR